MIAVSVLAGVAAIVLLVRRRYAWARISSSLAVAAVLIGWAVAQYPYVLPPHADHRGGGPRAHHAGGHAGRRWCSAR